MSLRLIKIEDRNIDCYLFRYLIQKSGYCWCRPFIFEYLVENECFTFEEMNGIINNST